MLSQRYLPEAQYVVERIVMALRDCKRSPIFREFVLTEHDGNVVLFAVLDELRLGEPVSSYLNDDVLHQISTLTNGKRVVASNHNGARYAVLLSKPKPLPTHVTLPAELPGDNSFALGVGLPQSTLVIPIQRLQNILIGGSPESGKSNLLELFALTASQYGYHLYLGDPEEHTFAPEAWNAVATRHVASSMSDFLDLLEAVKGELERRQALFQQAGRNGIPPKDLDAYNQTCAVPLPRLMLVVDEANSFLDKSNVAETLFELARRGRKWGAHVILAGHNWRAADVPRSLSSMFTTRICLKVDDDTSGGVVLGNRDWGRKAMHIRQKGRAILRLSGSFRTIQTYLVSDELKQQFREQLTIPSPITELEKEFIQYAIEHLEGRFKVNKLAEAFAGQGVTNYQVQKTAERFERRNWLTHPQHATDARRVTAELRDLAGLVQIGE